MNRIFKVIFSKTLGIHVVAGEKAKTKGKKSLKAVVAVAMMAGAMGVAGADPLCADDVCKIESSITAQETIEALNSQFSNAQNTTVTNDTSKKALFTTTSGISTNTPNVLLDGNGHSATFSRTSQSILNDSRNKSDSSISFQNFDKLTFSSNKAIFTIMAPFENSSDWNSLNPTPYSKAYKYTIDIGNNSKWINELNFEQQGGPSAYFIDFHEDVVPTVGGGRDGSTGEAPSGWKGQFATNGEVILSGKKDVALNIYAKDVNFGSDQNRGMYGITSNNFGLNETVTNPGESGSKIKISSENTSIYTVGSSIAQADIAISAHNEEGTGRILLDSYDVTIGGGNVVLDADEVIIRATYMGDAPDYGKDNGGKPAGPSATDFSQSERIAAINYGGAGDSALQITAKRATIETIDKDGNTANGVMAIQVASAGTRNAAGNINITTTEKLTVNGDVGYSQTNLYRESYSGDKAAEISLTAQGGEMEINGDIRTYNNSDEAKKNKNDIILKAAENAIINTNGDIKEDGESTDTNGVKISLTDSTWNVGGAENNIKSVNADNATINNTSDATINVGKLNTESGKATYNTTSAKAGQLQIAEKTGDGQLTVALDNADKLASGSSAEAAKKLAAIANVDGGDQAVTYTAGEGEVSGAITAQTNETGTVTSVSEAKNEVMESLKDIGSNNFLGFRAQMNDLDKRMGDLRTMPDSDGAWARVIAGQSQYKSSHNTYQTLQVGADHRIGNFVLGATASYTDGDGKQKNGSTDDKTYSFGLYGSWLNDDGQFIDVIVKRYHAMSDYDLRYTNGTRAKGSLDTSGTSISAEYGWRLGIEGTNYYVEPQVEFMYGHMNSFGYKTSNGVKVKQDAIKTAVGRVGMAAGWVDPNKAGSAYFKVSVLNDWEGDSYSKASKEGVSRKYHENMGGTWVEYAIGGTYNLSKNLSIYGEAETTSGNPVRTTYQVSAGMRYSF